MTGRGIGGSFVDSDSISKVLWEPREAVCKTKQDRVKFCNSICSLATGNSSWAEKPQGGAVGSP